MKKKNFSELLYCLFMIAVVCICLSAQELDPDQMMREAEKNLYPDNYYSKMTMTTIKPGKKTREITMESYYKKHTGTLMEILLPLRSKGIRFLEKEKNLYLFNPKSNSRSAIKLSAKDSFQGSVFSNNDVSDPDYSDDYSTSIYKKTFYDHPKLGRVECYILLAAAKNNNSTYGKIMMWVESDKLIPVKMEYYVRSGILEKRMVLSGLKFIAGRVRPTVMEMESLITKGHKSTIVTIVLETRNNLPDRMFTQSELTR